MKGLLHAFGENLAKLVNANSARGMRIDGDNIILDPKALTPPPHLNGRVTRVGIAGGKVVQYFDAGKHLAALKPPVAAPGFIYHRNGILRFGKLTMNDADLEIVGDRPGAFEFFQREYKKQLVAGFPKIRRPMGSWRIWRIIPASDRRERRGKSGGTSATR